MHLLARVAQRIERRFPKPGVAGSIPVASILPIFVYEASSVEALFLFDPRWRREYFA